MTERILQLHREKIIFWTLAGIFFLCASFYIFFIRSTINNIVIRQNLENEASTLTLSIGNQEFEYITKRNSVTLPLAYSMGFKDTASKTFISRNEPVKVALLSN